MEGYPWRSVSEALVQNKCWLCAASFKRGRVKKTFTVSQLWIYLLNETQVPENPALRTCWDAFQAMNRSEEELTRQLEAASLQPWMSGLVCVSTEECLAAFRILTSVDDASTLHISRPAKGESECPPNCGCDNPWPFMK